MRTYQGLVPIKANIKTLFLVRDLTQRLFKNKPIRDQQREEVTIK